MKAGTNVVIASRMMKGTFNEEDVHWFRPRKWANRASDWMAPLAWGRGTNPITDTINGCCAITADGWDCLTPDGPGYTIERQTSIRA